MPLPSATTYSSSQYLQQVTMSSLRTTLRVDLRDVAASRWTNAELDQCIKKTIEELSGLVKIPDIYETTFTGGVREYDLPAYIEDITTLERIGGVIGLTINNQTDYGPPIPILGYQHIWDPIVNRLYLIRLEPDGATMRIRYNRSLKVPPASATITAAISTTSQTTITVANANTYPVPGIVKVESEYIYYGSISATQLTGCIRGVLSSTAATHTNGVAIDCLLPVDMKIERVITLGATMYAHQMKLHDAPNSSISLELTLYKNAADLYKQAKSSVAGPVQPPVLEQHYNSRRRRIPLLN